MNFYSFEDINAAAACLRYVKEVLGWDMKNDRIQAKWRGGEGYNVAVDEHGWFDHKTKEKGGVIDLCAMTKFGGRDMAAKQQAQDFLGDWLGLTPEIIPERIQYDYRKHSLRFQELVREGYSEAKKYVYTNERGVPCHFTIRMEHPTKAKRFFQCTPWSSSLKGEQLYLYNLPMIAQSSWAIVVEGEKDADTLIQMGLPGTTCNCGADNWRDDYTESLRGKDVVICRDNDDAGNDHAHLLLRSLANAAKSLRVICPSKIHKGDVTDWVERENGNKDKLLRLLKAAPLITAEEAMWSDEALALYRAKEANKETFCNYRTETKIVNGKEKRVEVPRTINEMVEEAHVRFLGFPRRLGKSTLFDHDRDTGNIEFLQSNASTMAWFSEKSKHPVMWKSGNGLATKEEFYAALIRNSIAYEKISDVPNYPTRPDVYYAYRSALKPTPNHESFEKFMGFFNPGDSASAVLMRTMVASMMFYAPGIQRPCWIIDSRAGQAVGKTTFAELLCYLYKCAPIKTNVAELNHDAKELNKRIVSVTGRNSLMLLVDNVRGMFDNAYFADLVTGFNISGKAPYGIGEESRPNDLTYVITSNSATIGSDIASRSFIFYVAPPEKRTGAWKDMVIKFIDAHRYEILGDVYDILTTVVAPEDFVAQTRVPEFEREVLWKMAGSQEVYERVVEQVLANRSDANVDEENAILAVETIKEIICDTLDTKTPDEFVCFLRTNLVNKILGKTLHIDTQDIRNMVNTGKISCVRRDVRRYPRTSRTPYRASGILFVGSEVSTAQNVRVRILGLNKDYLPTEVTKDCGGIEDAVLTEELRAAKTAAEQAALNAQAIDVDAVTVGEAATLPAPQPVVGGSDDYEPDLETLLEET